MKNLAVDKYFTFKHESLVISLQAKNTNIIQINNNIAVCIYTPLFTQPLSLYSFLLFC